MKSKPIDTQSLQSHGIKDSVNFGIKASGLHHILGILRNQLYSDKVLAVLREYTCNAVDAQVEAGCGERPIEVSLPNAMSPYFKVRDFGVALSEDDIHNVYAFYGESTKRNTNDQIGMLGIGSKAAFAYGDNFVINSFLNGKKHVYNAFIDPSQVGQIAKLGEEDTDEENGIEIVVPVNDQDSDEFWNKAKKLFKWFKVRPLIHGGEQFHYDDSDILFSGDGWNWLDVKADRWNRSSTATVVMGNIGYPIEFNDLGENAPSELRELLADNLVLEMPIGDLEISASREKLQFTDFTRKKLIEKLEQVGDEIAETVKKEFSDCKTLFECKCLYGTVFDYGCNLYALRDILKDKLIFKGKKIESDTFHTYQYDSIVLHKMALPRRHGSSRYRAEETNNISCTKNAIVIENDMGHRRGLLGKVLGYILEQDKTVYLLEFKDSKDRKKWEKETGFDADMPKLSEVPQRPLSDFSSHGYGKQSSGGSSYTKDKKHTVKEFNVDWSVVDGSRWNDTKSAYFKPAEVDIANDDGVYVIIDRFFVQGTEKAENYRYTGDVNPRVLGTLKDDCESIGVKFPKNLIAVKIKNAEKIKANENMVLLWDWLQEQVNQKIEEQSLIQKYVDRVEANKVKDEWNVFKQEEKQATVMEANIQTNGLFMELWNKRKEMLHKDYGKKIDGFRTIASEVGVKVDTDDVKPTHDLFALAHKAKKKYELIEEIDIRWSWKDESAKKLANYITVIDVCSGDTVKE